MILAEWIDVWSLAGLGIVGTRGIMTVIVVVETIAESAPPIGEEEGAVEAGRGAEEGGTR